MNPKGQGYASSGRTKTRAPDGPGANVPIGRQGSDSSRGCDQGSTSSARATSDDAGAGQRLGRSGSGLVQAGAVSAKNGKRPQEISLRGRSQVAVYAQR